MPVDIREGDDGELEMECSICGDYWPMAGEFFWRNYGQFVPPCKACWYERYRPGERKKRHAPFSRQEKEDILFRYKAGESEEEIAGYLDASPYTIIEIVKLMGG